MLNIKKAIAILLWIMPLVLIAWPNYKTVFTPNFEVYYRDGWETEAENVLQALEYSRPYVVDLIGNSPGRLAVVLSDMGNTVNGYASPVQSKIGLYAYPPSSDELSLSEDWWQLVGIHEFIHIAQMTRTSGEPALLRAIFGNILYPNLYQPMWMTEGITVYGESQLSELTGRLNAGTYPAIISALAREGRLPSPGKACYYSYSNPLANYYVYGSSFHKYLADTYGEDKFSVLYEGTSGSLAAYLNPITSSFSLDLAYEDAFGKNVADLWTAWQTDSFRQSTPLPTEKVTDDGWNKEDLKHYNGVLYYTQRKVSKTGPSSSFSSNRLMRLVSLDGKPYASTLVEQNSDFPAGYQIAGDKLYYSRSELKTGYANNDNDGLGVITEIWEQNLGGGDRQKLFSGPIRAFCSLEPGHFLVAEDDATHQKTVLYEFFLPTGIRQDMGTLDHLVGNISQSGGKIYVTARKFWQNNSIYELDINSLRLKPVIDTPYLETLCSVSGNDLTYNAVYEGKNGSYLYKLDSKQLFQYSGYSEIKNACKASQSKTYFLSINGDGYDIYQDELKLMAYNLPQTQAEKAPYARLNKDSDPLIMDTYPVQKGSYAKNIGHMLWPRLYRFPYISGSVNQDGTSDSLIVGIQMAGSDVTGDFPMWNATVLYDIGKKDWGYQLGLENNFFSPIKHTIEYTNLGEKALSSVQYIPFLQRVNYGLTAAWAGFGFTTSDNFARKIWYPFLGMNFSGKGIKLNTNNQLLFETQDFFASDRDRLGWQGKYNLRVKAPLSTELRSNIAAAWDPAAVKTEVFPSMRGYEANWGNTTGVQISNSWYAPILKIRDGIWNPNIYIEDINLGLFYDYAYPGDKDPTQIRYSYGAELIAELFAGYNYGLNLGVRFSYNKDGEYLTSLILGI